jgi:CDP-diacylglycerol--serine O-phosphatidyltransferase
MAYTLLIAGLMVSTTPTFSGKLLGERISREWVLPLFVLALSLVALMVTYPYTTLTAVTLLYLATIPVSVSRFGRRLDETEAAEATARAAVPRPEAKGSEAKDQEPQPPADPAQPTRH